MLVVLVTMFLSVEWRPSVPSLPIGAQYNATEWEVETHFRINSAGNTEMPHCVLARLQKCGGSTVTKVMHHTLHWAALHGSEVNAVVIRESGGLRASNILRGDVVIAQIRNPWTYYVSLWCYMSDIYTATGGKGWPPNVPGLYSQELPHGRSAADRKRFAAFVRFFNTPVIGVLSLHVWVNYVLPATGNEMPTVIELASTVDRFMRRPEVRGANVTAAWIAAHIREKLPAVMKQFCWVKAEEMAKDAEKCFQRCASLFNPPIKYLYQHAILDRPEIGFHLRANPSLPSVSLDVFYQDNGLVRGIQEADSAIFDAFSYSKNPF